MFCFWLFFRSFLSSSTSFEDVLTSEQNLDADILLVEDDPNDAELVRRALKRAGAVASIVHVQDGAEALDYL